MRSAAESPEPGAANGHTSQGVPERLASGQESVHTQPVTTCQGVQEQEQGRGRSADLVLGTSKGLV